MPLYTIKNPLPESTNKFPAHYVHKLKGQTGEFTKTEIHPTHKFQVTYLKIQTLQSEIWFKNEWIEEQTPETYEEIFKRKRDENLKAMFS